MAEIINLNPEFTKEKMETIGKEIKDILDREGLTMIVEHTITLIPKPTRI